MSGVKVKALEWKAILPCPFCGWAVTADEGLCKWDKDEFGDTVDEIIYTGVCCPGCSASVPINAKTADEAIAAWNRRATSCAANVPPQEAVTYYTEGKDADWFAALGDAEFAKRASYAAMDVADGDFESIEKWMPICGILTSAADRIKRLSSGVAVKALEWRGSNYADTPFGEYTIDRDEDDAVAATPWCCWSLVDGGTNLGHFASESEAQAAGQADYSRIRSALE